MRLPQGGKVFISVRDEDKPSVAPVAEKLYRVGFRNRCDARHGGSILKRGDSRLKSSTRFKKAVRTSAIKSKTARSRWSSTRLTDAHSQADSYHIRRCALDYQVPYFTTIAGAEAAAEGIEYLKQREFDVKALQDYEAPLLP